MTLDNVQLCSRCARFGDHDAATHPFSPMTASAHKWYREIRDERIGTFFNPRYKYPLLHALRLEDVGLVFVRRSQFDRWWMQIIDRTNTVEAQSLLTSHANVFLTDASRTRLTAIVNHGFQSEQP